MVDRADAKPAQVHPGNPGRDGGRGFVHALSPPGDPLPVRPAQCGGFGANLKKPPPLEVHPLTRGGPPSSLQTVTAMGLKRQIAAQGIR